MEQIDINTNMEKGTVHHGLTADQIKELREKKLSELDKKDVASLQEALTVKERLERKLKTDVIELKLKDDLGDFSLHFRKLTPQEHDMVAHLQRRMKTEPDKEAELTKQLYELLGRVSLDGLDEDFWKNGTGFSPDVFITAIIKIMTASSFPEDQYFDQITKFRSQ